MKSPNVGAVSGTAPNYRSQLGSLTAGRRAGPPAIDANAATLAAAGAAGYFLAAGSAIIHPLPAAAAAGAAAAEQTAARIGLDGAPVHEPKPMASGEPAPAAPKPEAIHHVATAVVTVATIIGDPALGDELDDAGLSPLLAQAINEIPAPVDPGPAPVVRVFAPFATIEPPQAVSAPPPRAPTPTDASIGARVWVDANSDGLQSAGELGAQGVTVRLENAAGMLLQTAVTDGGGHYAFSNLAAGGYQLQFVAPPGRSFTGQHTGSDPTLDSDAGANGLASPITLGVSEHNTSIDAGLLPPPAAPPTGSIGDHIWIDWNSNGLWDQPGIELGAVGLTVTLLDATSGSVVQTTHTDDTGAYLFSGLAAGAYRVQFSTLPLYTYTTEHAGSDPTVDSDADPTTGLSQVITLAQGETDLTLDAGLIFTGVTPIVLDLDRNGIQTTALDPTRGEFDLLANGSPVHSGWSSSGDAFLAADLNGNGVIDSRAELFGGRQQGDGFAQLASYDTNHDGVVDGSDANFGRLQVWQDLNENHRTDPGELHSLVQAGIASLGVACVDQAIVQNGNVLGQTGRAQLADGSTVTMTDVSFGYLPSAAAAPSAPAPAASPAAAPALAQLLTTANTVLDRALGGAASASLPAEHASAEYGRGEHDDSEPLRRLAHTMQTHAKLIAG